MPSRTPAELALKYFNSQAQRSREGIVDVLHEQFIAHTPWGPRDLEGALASWERFWELLPPSTMTVRNVQVAEPQTVIIEITMHFRPAEEDPRSDHDVDVCDVMRIQDGRIIEIRAYFDRGGVDSYAQLEQ